MSLNRVLVALLLGAFAGSAAAHPGMHEAVGFFSGFAHPFGGADHVLAMLAVGLFAAREKGAARWALPAGFVAAMLGGAGLAAARIALPAVEAGVAASVLVLGLFVARLAALPLGASLPAVALFGLAHGYAHVAEAGAPSLLTYVAGFALATALLHAVGYVAARAMPESRLAARATRMAGALIAGAGAMLLGA